MNSIVIKDLLIETIVGIHNDERHTKQNVKINLELEVEEFPNLDNPDDPLLLDYSEVARKIEALIVRSEFFLVETMANAIAKMLTDEYSVTRISIEIDKPSAIKNAGSAGVKITRYPQD